MKYYHTPSLMAETSKDGYYQVLVMMESVGILIHCRQNYNLVHFGNTFSIFY